MDTVIQRLLDLAAEVPAELPGTAGTLRLAASGLSYRRETPTEAAVLLRKFATESRERAGTWKGDPSVAAWFIRRAEILDGAANLLEEKAVA
jgi:hypothetical protein